MTHSNEFTIGIYEKVKYYVLFLCFPLIYLFQVLA